MAAIADLDDLIDRTMGGSSGTPVIYFGDKTTTIDQVALTDGITTGRLVSSWLLDGNPRGATPPTSVAAPTSSTTGAIPYTNAGGARDKFVTGFFVTGMGRGVSYPINPVGAVLYDRLLHISGLDPTVLTAQTVGGTITRNTGGIGNRIYIEIVDSVSTAQNYITADYTNQAGTASRTTQQRDLGISAGYRHSQGTIIDLPLQAGDTGVRSIQSITIQASLTSGDIAVVMGKPIAMSFGNQLASRSVDSSLGLGVAPIEDNACLAFMAWDMTTGESAYKYGLSFVEA